MTGSIPVAFSQLSKLRSLYVHHLSLSMLCFVVCSVSVCAIPCVICFLLAKISMILLVYLSRFVSDCRQLQSSGIRQELVAGVGICATSKLTGGFEFKIQSQKSKRLV